MLIKTFKFRIDVSFKNKRQVFENTPATNIPENLPSTEKVKENIEKTMDNPAKIEQEAMEKAARYTDRAKTLTDRLNFPA